MRGRSNVSGLRNRTRVERRYAAVSVADAIQATGRPRIGRLIARDRVNGAVIIPHPAKSSESALAVLGFPAPALEYTVSHRREAL
ncbi:MAG: hypothetical protein QG637_439 [Chloroflexota bacterium]|nr:hypothetical protein [Chloroflexota bacterium]